MNLESLISLYSPINSEVKVDGLICDIIRFKLERSSYVRKKIHFEIRKAKTQFYFMNKWDTFAEPYDLNEGLYQCCTGCQVVLSKRRIQKHREGCCLYRETNFTKNLKSLESSDMLVKKLAYKDAPKKRNKKPQEKKQLLGKNKNAKKCRNPSSCCQVLPKGKYIYGFNESGSIIQTRPKKVIPPATLRIYPSENHGDPLHQ